MEMRSFYTNGKKEGKGREEKIGKSFVKHIEMYRSESHFFKNATSHQTKIRVRKRRAAHWNMINSALQCCLSIDFVPRMSKG